MEDENVKFRGAGELGAEFWMRAEGAEEDRIYGCDDTREAFGVGVCQSRGRAKDYRAR